MLLLLLFILWANRPMHFPTPLRYAVLIVAGFGLSICPIGEFTGNLVGNSRSTVHAASPQNTESTLANNDIRQKKESVLLREGTRIPITAGRITKLGSRWALTVLTGEPDDAEATMGVTNDGKVETIKRPEKEAALIESLRESGQRMKLPTMMVLVENLALQRVVTSIRTDSADVYWSVTGEVTEFGGENRLIIRTAQRAIPD